ncbi:MAG TPA: AgmX/PglI C-terminal domain-containing protein [Labilithrix sp.]|nr:AgmX/PglI C-terminal domain-containing protein [Labilithrix sp.]
MSLSFRLCSLVLCVSALVACGGEKPPPKAPEPPTEEAPKQESSGGPAVEQELGSIDQRAVEKKFDELQTKLEVCHKQGRDRVEYLAGDVKVFLRVGKDGRVKYAYFEESTLGDRATEKCLLDLFAATDWPKPQGGEAEIRNGFGWPAGSERQPTTWGPEKVSSALDEDKETKKGVEKCKSGTSGEFHVTAYVEPGEVEEHHPAAKGPGKAADKAHAKGGKKPAHKNDKKGQHAATDQAAAKGAEHGGKFKSIGVTPPGKEGAEKVDCIVDALRGLPLPSPGSYAAKVTFSL